MKVINILHARTSNPKARKKQIRMLIKYLKLSIKESQDWEDLVEMRGFIKVLQVELDYLNIDYPLLQKYRIV